MNIKDKYILIIAHSYKPLLNPRAFRWTTIAEEWIKADAKVDIVTSWQPGQARQEIISGVNVYRVGGSIVEKLRDLLRSSDQKTSVHNDKTKTSAQPSLLKHLIKISIRLLHDITWKKLYWPDYACMWKKPAVEKALSLLALRKYDKLVTVSDPFTSHLVGEEINKQYPQLFWLVDIGDPFCYRYDTPTNNHALYRNLNIKTEKNIFSLSDKVSVTTESTKAKYAELFPESADKIYVIPPIMAPHDKVANQKNIFSGDDKIRLVFVGTLYKTIRNPKFLLDLFDRLMTTQIDDKLELHFFGGINDCAEEFKRYEKYKNQSLFVHGLVKRETVLKAMEEASVLINIGNDNIYQLPSKVVEYMLTGKPILNIVKLEDDSSASFMKTYPSKQTLLDSNDSSGDEEYEKFQNFINHLPADLNKKQCDEWEVKYCPDTISKQYLEIGLESSPEMETVS